MSGPRILVVRLGAMGDVIHALPAVATLKRSFPAARLTWAIDPKWAVLLDGNPYVDEMLLFDRRDWSSVRAAWRALRRERYDTAIDFQGLIKSALLAAASGARDRIGFDRSLAREPLASLFYRHAVRTTSAHVVDRNLELAHAAGANQTCREFPIPPGREEGELPDGRFVLACPLAGWASKQWPIECYSSIVRSLREDGYSLVVNGAPAAREILGQIDGAHVHLSGIEGLIDATRRAAGVIGVDSGPLHLAAALCRPGVAIFGPTDPARNGPYGGTITVLREPGARASYKRGRNVSASMRAVRPEVVADALRVRLSFHAERTGTL
jgi:heptosyltransferase-1